VQGAGCKVQGAGCRAQGTGCRVQGAGSRVQGSGFRIQGAGSRDPVGAGLVEASRAGEGRAAVGRVDAHAHALAEFLSASGFRVQGSGFRVQGAGFRVQGLAPALAELLSAFSCVTWRRNLNREPRTLNPEP